jgi:hypothetical protein
MVLLFVACSAGPGAAPAPQPAPAPPAAAPVPSPDPAEDGGEPATFEGTIGVVDQPAAGGGMATLQQLRATDRDGFDRVAFQFSGGLPGYHVEYVDRPVRKCGSGDTVPVAGDAWLEIRLTPAQAHTEAGEPTLPFQERELDLGVVRELQQTCDFEGMVTWVIGVASPGPYRIIEREDPPRLIVDIEG